jgi:hypothetical protein
MEQQQVSFGYLFESVRPGGYYIIEDVHTSVYAIHQDRFGATKTGEGTTLAMIDHFIRTGQIESAFMTAEERADLTRNLEYASLLSRDEGRGITCIFKKKDLKDSGRKRGGESG